MSKIAAMTFAALLGASVSTAFAQSALPTSPVTTDIRELRGDAPDYPRISETMIPGTGRPAIPEGHDVVHVGDMPDHPHDKPTPGSAGPVERAPLPAGDMPFYPSIR
ncbi:MAG: hypothetical protein ACOZCP_08490 [Pseudomonadota bacterium]